MNYWTELWTSIYYTFVPLITQDPTPGLHPTHIYTPYLHFQPVIGSFLVVPGRVLLFLGRYDSKQVSFLVVSIGND